MSRACMKACKILLHKQHNSSAHYMLRKRPHNGYNNATNVAPLATDISNRHTQHITHQCHLADRSLPVRPTTHELIAMDACMSASVQQTLEMRAESDIAFTHAVCMIKSPLICDQEIVRVVEDTILIALVQQASTARAASEKKCHLRVKYQHCMHCTH